MKKQDMDVIDRIVPLLETIEEGLQHMPEQLTDARYEEFLILFQDILEAIDAISHSLITVALIKPGLNRPEVKRAKTILEKTLAGIINTLENGDLKTLPQEITTLQKKYSSWRKQVEKNLKK